MIRRGGGNNEDDDNKRKEKEMEWSDMRGVFFGVLMNE